ncbi:LPS export ABC transporter permease LptG [Thioclava sp. F36-7]|uniref:LPS export ABC transporter permease LptG n=1 Tax=Thioclava sp. F36-7 TaxID=1915317 RepID=UPI0009987C85|nr:LPS export ABC transporter permease LptG [Thioclava sp. F36-7]OOY09504.1 LPS export ABC transporter permease LptG [Thioclava sp. F36-7]
MTLALYLAKRFLRSFLIVAASFWGILFLIDVVEEIRRFSDQGLSLLQLSVLSALNIPETIYTILPLIVMLSAVALFVALARSSELVVIRAAGRSALRMLAAPIAAALVLGLLALLVGNPLVSATSKRYEILVDHYTSDGGSTVSIGREGVWMRQSAGLASDGKSLAQAVIHAERANGDATTLHGVTFLIFDPNRGPVRRIDAKTATLVPGAWQLQDVKDWPLGESTNPERDATTQDSLSLPSDLTVASIRDSFGKPSAVPIWQLPSFIASLEDAGFSARRHIVWFQMELALPVLLAAMVLIAASFTMDHVRFGGIGAKVLLALAAGLGLFFLRNIAQVLGDNGQIPVLLAAWAPPVIGLMLPLARLLHREDG